MRTDLLKDAARSSSRVVVKLGTGVLTDAKKQPDIAQMEQLVAQVAQQRQLGRDVILVSSGAVGAGMGVLKHEKRPSELAELQACALDDHVRETFLEVRSACRAGVAHA
jgi:glutamate 5-kinase